MIYLLAFVAAVLATARLTRVFNIDEIAAPLRDWILKRWPAPSKPAKLVGCYWCASFWVALIVCSWIKGVAVAAGWADPETLLLLLVEIPAVAYAASWVLDREEQ